MPNIPLDHDTLIRYTFCFEMAMQLKLQTLLPHATKGKGWIIKSLLNRSGGSGGKKLPPSNQVLVKKKKIISKKLIN